MGLFLEGFEKFGSDFEVFEIVRTVGAEDGFFVTFAKNENEVAFLGEAEGFVDGGTTIELDEEVFAHSFVGFLDAFNELGGDSGRVFVTGIVFGDDDSVAVFAEDFATESAGRFVAATGTTVDGDNFARVIFD